MTSSMNRAVACARRSFLGLGVALGASAMSGCSSQIEWKEEVPLNTGDTIWVTRTARYERVLTGPLALELGWEIMSESLAFNWKDRSYQFSDVVPPDYLLIDPQARTPVLITSLAHWQFKKRYGCRVPFYVEYRPTGDGWAPQSKIDETFYGMKGNLMRWRPLEPEMPAMLSAGQRERNDFERFNWGTKGILRADYSDPNCNVRN